MFCIWLGGVSAKSKQADFRIKNEIIRLHKKERRDMTKKKETSKKSFEYPIREEGLILNGGAGRGKPEIWRAETTGNYTARKRLAEENTR